MANWKPGDDSTSYSDDSDFSSIPDYFTVVKATRKTNPLEEFGGNNLVDIAVAVRNTSRSQVDCGVILDNASSSSSCKPKSGIPSIINVHNSVSNTYESDHRGDIARIKKT